MLYIMFIAVHDYNDYIYILQKWCSLIGQGSLALLTNISKDLYL